VRKKDVIVVVEKVIRMEIAVMCVSNIWKRKVFDSDNLAWTRVLQSMNVLEFLYHIVATYSTILSTGAQDSSKAIKLSRTSFG
jgi:hypothetical protein